MAENSVRVKRKMNAIGKSKDNMERKIDKSKTRKLKQLKKKRLIVRNLSFKISEEELKKLFSQFGEVLDVKIPVNEAGKKRGFAFIQFKDTTAQIKAMKKLNFQKINGRPIAIDFAVDKTTYQSFQNGLKSSDSTKDGMLKETDFDKESEDSIDEDIKPETKSRKEDYDSNIADESEDEEDAKVKAFLKEFDANEESVGNYENETSAESSEDTDESESINSIKHDSDDDDTSIRSKPFKKRKSEDVSEGKTVFIRNISFKNTDEDLQEVVQEHGETVYCLLCMDPLTGHFKGTAFVKFKEKESADKLIEESSKEPGILLDGRKLICTYALSREELSKKYDGSEKVKDKRNLRLLKCGLIVYGSKESEGVSQTDMAKRAQLEIAKKQKLQNVNFFVSDKRLVCHNLPKNINDKDLYILFKKAAGKEAVVKEARVMRDFKKTDAQGIPTSRGFGFIAFTEHEHALKALMELNNNPKVFTSNKRPIVEFSVENKVALLSQERRREKIKLRNKKKLEEQSNSKCSQTDGEQESSKLHSQKKKKQSTQKKRKQIGVNSYSSEKVVSQNKKKKPFKSRRKKSQDVQKGDDLSVLTKKYKEKLLNKFS